MSERLALHGGSPVRRTLLPYGRQTVDEHDVQAVVQALTRGGTVHVVEPARMPEPAPLAAVFRY